MKKQTALDYFKSTKALAEAASVNPSAISQWGEYPPDNRQLQIERVTLGALKAEPGCMDRVLGFKEKAAA
jgi:DNA-binding transcriptional regulator YdaS (Cro superfamily)